MGPELAEKTEETTPVDVEETPSSTVIDDAAEEKLWEAHSDRHPPQPDAGVDEPEEADEPVKAVAEPERAEDGKFAAKKASPRRNPQARVQQATAEAAEARRLLAEREARIAELERERETYRARPAVSTEATKADVKDQKKAAAFYGDDVTRPFPNINEFGDDPDPVARMFYEGNKWMLEQERYQSEKQKAETDQRTMLTEASNRIAEARQADPQFDTHVATIDRVIAQSGVRNQQGQPAFPPALFTAIAKSSRIAELTQFFGQHPEDCAQWIQETKDLPASAATVVLRSLEASLPAVSAAARADSARPAPRSIATAPINRVGGSANASPLSEDELSDEEWWRQEDAKELRLKKAGLKYRG